jgi:hypothetical protein
LSSLLFNKNLKIKIYKKKLTSPFFVWVCIMVSHTKRRTQTESVLEQGAEENIWAKDGGCCGKLEKTA